VSVIYLTDRPPREGDVPVSRLALESAAARNRLVAALPADERDRLLLHSMLVVLPNERVLLAPRE